MSAEYRLYWVRADKQGTIDMGAYPSEDSASRAISDARKELISQCVPGTEHEIDKGTWSIEKEVQS